MMFDMSVWQTMQSVNPTTAFLVFLTTVAVVAVARHKTEGSQIRTLLVYSTLGVVGWFLLSAFWPYALVLIAVLTAVHFASFMLEHYVVRPVDNFKQKLDKVLKEEQDD